jgi:hypothetical protein
MIGIEVDWGMFSLIGNEAGGLKLRKEMQIRKKRPKIIEWDKRIRFIGCHFKRLCFVVLRILLYCSISIEISI